MVYSSGSSSLGVRVSSPYFESCVQRVRAWVRAWVYLSGYFCPGGMVNISEHTKKLLTRMFDFLTAWVALISYPPERGTQSQVVKLQQEADVVLLGRGGVGQRGVG